MFWEVTSKAGTTAISTIPKNKTTYVDCTLLFKNFIEADLLFQFQYLYYKDYFVYPEQKTAFPRMKKPAIAFVEPGEYEKHKSELTNIFCWVLETCGKDYFYIRSFHDKWKKYYWYYGPENGGIYSPDLKEIVKPKDGNLTTNDRYHFKIFCECSDHQCKDIDKCQIRNHFDPRLIYSTHSGWVYSKSKYYKKVSKYVCMFNHLFFNYIY